jgi:hypothetical protein
VTPAEIRPTDKFGLLEVLRKIEGRSRFLCFCRGCNRTRTVKGSALRDGAKACERCTEDMARLKSAPVVDRDSYSLHKEGTCPISTE